MTLILLTNGEGGAGAIAAAAALQSGESALNAIETGIKLVESDPKITDVGLGGIPNILGQVECDASIIDGSTLQAGSVGAIKGFKHPISVARQLFERLPHVLLVGEGASRFAAEINAEKHELLTESAKADWQAWLQKKTCPKMS